ncbi:hypothetical protein F5Y11DRAFT_2648 [Daldinia sp. FL1419]|nr:hypothetical protein F5Y11DRAFT_2648 [Daldinia sp. FL1419]
MCTLVPPWVLGDLGTWGLGVLDPWAAFGFPGFMKVDIRSRCCDPKRSRWAPAIENQSSPMPIYWLYNMQNMQVQSRGVRVKPRTSHITVLDGTLRKEFRTRSEEPEIVVTFFFFFFFFLLLPETFYLSIIDH